MRKEFQLKISGSVDLSLLINLGGEPLGQVSQKDIYLCGEHIWRIREENGQYVFARKSHDIGQKARIKDVSEKLISRIEAEQLIKEKGVRFQICKSRNLYRLNETVITVDEVEHIGVFSEIRSSSEKELLRVIHLLGAKDNEIIKASYLDMMIAQALPGWVQTILRIHEKVGELAFGITSGILTTVGVLTGVNSATSSKLSVIAAIVAIAVADSCSDAFGMYMSKISERGNSHQVAWRHALGTFAGKFLFPLTFLLPIMLCPINLAVQIDLWWGATALALLSAEQAIVARQSISRSILKTECLAIIIVVFSVITGWAVSLLIK